MIVEQALVAVLEAYSGLTDLVTTTRIYPMKLPANATLPAVTYQRISGAREDMMGEPTGLARPVFQVTAWADDYLEAKTVATQVRKALDGYEGQAGGSSGVWSWIGMLNDVDMVDNTTDPPTYYVPADFLIWHQEA